MDLLSIDDKEFENVEEDYCYFVFIDESDSSVDIGGEREKRKPCRRRRSKGRLSRELEVRTREGRNIHRHRFSVAGSSDLCNILGFYLRYSIYTQINFNFNINISNDDFQPVIGSNGTLYKVETKSGLMFLKCFNLFDGMENFSSCIARNYAVLPRLMGVQKLINSTINFKYCLIMEGLNPPILNRNNMLDMLANIKELHSKGLIHGDVHPDNIMMDSCNSLKLIDPINIILGKVVLYQPKLYSSLTTSEEYKVLLDCLMNMYCTQNGKSINELIITSNIDTPIDFTFSGQGKKYVDVKDQLLLALAINEYSVSDVCNGGCNGKYITYESSSDSDDGINDDLQ